MRPPARGPHFFVAPDDIDGRQAVLRGDDAHHLARVLRAGRGDEVSLADGRGAVWQARVAALAEAPEVRLTLGERWDVEAPRPRLVVVHALPKGRKLDAVVQDLSEVGADALVPVVTERSEVRLDGDRAARAARRWEAVALAAAKQARRARPLEIEPVGAWPPSLRPGASGAVLWEEATTPLRDVLGAGEQEPGSAGDVVLAVGPEGGLTAGEVAACDLPPAALGPTILRTETAALVATSIVLHRLGRLG